MLCKQKRDNSNMKRPAELTLAVKEDAPKRARTEDEVRIPNFCFEWCHPGWEGAPGVRFRGVGGCPRRVLPHGPVRVGTLCTLWLTGVLLSSQNQNLKPRYNTRWQARMAGRGCVFACAGVR